LREPINLLQSISVFFHLSQGRIEELTSLLSEMSGTPITMQMTLKWLGLEPQMKEIPSDSRTKNLIDGLTEDPEDNLDGFIPIIELHNARLNKAHLLHEATSDIIKQKWVEDTDLEDIGKFLQSWAPEPYRNKPMPKGMIQALLGIAPNSQVWVPTDLSNCIFRNTEAADSIDDLVRSLKSLGTLQDKAWKARRRAGERREHRNKTQNTLLERISLLTAALTETAAPLQPKDRIKGATRKAMQGLGFLHLKTTFQKLVRQHDSWKALLTVEIGKAEKLLDKENLKQSRRDDRRHIGRKNEIFKHGIKGIKKITGKYNTSKPLTEVKISYPCGLKWKW